MSKLKQIVENPCLNLVSGTILILTAGNEILRTLDEGHLGPHHGVAFFGLVQILQSLPLVNIQEAKNNLSRLVEQAARGISFLIAKEGKPLVKVVSFVSSINFIVNIRARQHRPILLLPISSAVALFNFLLAIPKFFFYTLLHLRCSFRLISFVVQYG